MSAKYKRTQFGFWAANSFNVDIEVSLWIFQGKREGETWRGNVISSIDIIESLNGFSSQ